MRFVTHNSIEYKKKVCFFNQVMFRENSKQDLPREHYKGALSFTCPQLSTLLVTNTRLCNGKRKKKVPQFVKILQKPFVYAQFDIRTLPMHYTQSKILSYQYRYNATSNAHSCSIWTVY